MKKTKTHGDGGIELDSIYSADPHIQILYELMKKEGEGYKALLKAFVKEHPIKPSKRVYSDEEILFFITQLLELKLSVGPKNILSSLR